jgi:hypothetical protein
MSIRDTAALYRRRGSDVTDEDIATAEALERDWRAVAHRSGVTDEALRSVCALGDHALDAVLCARRARDRAELDARLAVAAQGRRRSGR